jgi:hypothetical protein
MTLLILSMTTQAAPSLILNLIVKSMEGLTNNTSNTLGSLIHVPYQGLMGKIF